MDNSLSNVGADIRKLRIEQGLSQEQLSNMCGVGRSQLSRIEAGEVLGVTYSTIDRILSSLGREINFIVKDHEEKKYNIRPFVKWAGGKTQLLDVINQHLPSSFNRYFEPFVGGGALLFSLQPKSFSINDMNSELICVYQCFQNDELFESLKNELINHEKNHSESYFYKIRETDKDQLFNALPIYVRAARMIYLNKSCFNGLYRVNSKGFYNVPFGKKSKINCFDRDNFDNLRRFFKSRKCIVTNVDFAEAVRNARSGDFIYFDPPYDTWDGKDSFTSYDKNAFGKDAQIRLANVFKELSNRGVYVMLSNHNTHFIQGLYKGFHINVVSAKRIINSNANGRGAVEEVLITNYE